MPPHPPTHRACQTPNPPWWCGEQPEMILDQHIGVLLSIGLIIGLVYLSMKEKI